MFRSSAIEVKEERHGCVFDDSEETGKPHPKKSIKVEEYESNLDEIHNCSVAVGKFLDTRDVCVSQIDKICKPNIFCCYFCNLKFETKSNMKKHLSIHAATKPSAYDMYNSIISPKSYPAFNTCEIKNNFVPGLEDNSEKNRNEGFRRHSKKQFFCEVCDYKCTRNSSLSINQITFIN